MGSYSISGLKDGGDGASSRCLQPRNRLRIEAHQLMHLAVVSVDHVCVIPMVLHISLHFLPSLVGVIPRVNMGR